jgi:hypothetical protein
VKPRPACLLLLLLSVQSTYSHVGCTVPCPPRFEVIPPTYLVGTEPLAGLQLAYFGLLKASLNELYDVMRIYVRFRCIWSYRHGVGEAGI